ncbi:MAG: C4-type zinc ribbon domain-containing protein [Actinomycetota bacterium]|nr:C4-type zinc ribbon domain-containing protein [Actinomycetota bacterium]
MSTEIDATALRHLLEVQTHDSAIARLNHRKSTLPEARRLAEISGQLAELQADLEIAGKQFDELRREQDRIEGEIQILDQKTQREESRLFSGGVSSPKELSALQAEVAMLKKKRGEIDDTLLEIMVQKDDAASTQARLRAEHDEATKERESLSRTVEELSSDIDKELGEHLREREAVAAEVSEGLLSTYEKIRDQKGGIGAAALRGGTCEGCHTQLPAREVEEIKSQGGVHRCDNCRRILVVV